MWPQGITPSTHPCSLPLITIANAPRSALPEPIGVSKYFAYSHSRAFRGGSRKKYKYRLCRVSNPDSLLTVNRLFVTRSTTGCAVYHDIVHVNDTGAISLALFVSINMLCRILTWMLASLCVPCKCPPGSSLIISSSQSPPWDDWYSDSINMTRKKEYN